jgi:hypothetical protein
MPSYRYFALLLLARSYALYSNRGAFQSIKAFRGEKLPWHYSNERFCSHRDYRKLWTGITSNCLQRWQFSEFHCRLYFAWMLYLLLAAFPHGDKNWSTNTIGDVHTFPQHESVILNVDELLVKDQTRGCCPSKERRGWEGGRGGEGGAGPGSMQ